MNNSRLYNPRQFLGTMLIIVLTLGICLYAIYVARRAEAREEIRVEISQLILQYKNGKTQYIDFSKVSSITWDRLYIFGPYVQLKNIQGSLGYAWRPDTFFFPGPDRGFTYLFFTCDGKVIQYVEYPVDWGIFAEMFTKRVYTPDEAHFVMNSYGSILDVEK